MEVLTFDPPVLDSEPSALKLIPEASTDGGGGRRGPLPGQDVRSPKASGGHAGQARDFIKQYVGRETRPLNWSWNALKAILGLGGMGILLVSLSSLDMLFHIKMPFWAGFIVAYLPLFIFFMAEPESLPRRFIRPAKRFASVLYLVFAALSLSLQVLLIAYRGFDGRDVLVVGLIMLGAWPCLVVLRQPRLRRETKLFNASRWGASTSKGPVGRSGVK
jgi:hypothetical protein